MKKSLGIIIFLVAAWVSTEASISCVNYNPDICLPDMRGVCLVNGTMVMGTCDAQAAICGEGALEASEMGCCTGTAECRALNAASMPSATIFLTAVLVLFPLLSLN